MADAASGRVPIDVRVTLADQHDLRPSATRVTQVPRLAVSPVAVWAFGVGVSMALLLASLYRVRTLARRGLPPADSRWQDIAADLARSRCLTHRFELVQTSAPDMLATTGVRRHRVLLPARADRWPDSRIRIVLSHELAHIERRDWVIKIAGEIARAWLWFNPLIWLACRELARKPSTPATTSSWPAASRHATMPPTWSPWPACVDRLAAVLPPHYQWPIRPPSRGESPPCSIRNSINLVRRNASWRRAAGCC